MQKVVILIIALIFKGGFIFSQKNMNLEPFIGTWALTLPHNGFNDAGWLEIAAKDGFIYSSLLWYGGSVTPWDHAYISGKNLIITKVNKRKTVQGEELSVTSWIELKVEDDQIVGIRNDPEADGSGIRTFEFRGQKLPDNPPRPDLSNLKFGEAIPLLEENSLKGWSRLVAWTAFLLLR